MNSSQAVVLLLIMLRVQGSDYNTPGFWIGTAPGCIGDTIGCGPFDMNLGQKDASGDGATCFTGWKVRCTAKPHDVVTKYQLNSPGIVEAMTWDVFEPTHSPNNYHNGQAERTCRIPRMLTKKMPKLDVLAIQELYIGGCMDSHVNMSNLFEHYGWTHHSKSSDLTPGLMLVSRHKLHAIKHVRWHNGGSVGGFLYAYFRKYHLKVHVITANLRGIFRDQFAHQIWEFLEQRRIPSEEAVLFLGHLDLNIMKDEREHQRVTKLFQMMRMSPLVPKHWPSYNFNSERNDLVSNDHEHGKGHGWYDYVAFSLSHALPFSYRVNEVELRAEEEFEFCKSSHLAYYWVWSVRYPCMTAWKTRHLSEFFPVYAKMSFL